MTIAFAPEFLEQHIYFVIISPSSEMCTVMSKDKRPETESEIEKTMKEQQNVAKLCHMCRRRARKKEIRIREMEKKRK